MQMPTHFVTGIVIDKFIRAGKPSRAPSSAIVALLSYLSHGVLDVLSRLTYHPPDPQPEDRFWWTYHRIVQPFTTVAILIKYWRPHKWAMIFSILPDLDWIVRAIRRKDQIFTPFWKRPILNESVSQIALELPVVRQVTKLPDLKHNKSAALIEGGLLFSMLGMILIMGGRKANLD